jgi:hypothetical protein
VFEAVTGFPDDLVRDRLAELSADRSFSIKWRRKFQTALEGAEDDLAAEDDWAPPSRAGSIYGQSQEPTHRTG